MLTGTFTRPNEISDWTFSHNVTTSLEISGDNTLISKMLLFFKTFLLFY